MSDSTDRVFLALQDFQTTSRSREEKKGNNKIALADLFLHEIARVFLDMNRRLQPKGYQVNYDRGN